MALVNMAVPYRSFDWDIQHPFIPWSLSMARFWHSFPIFTRWKVLIEPGKRRINWWTFKVHLQIENIFDGRREIRADRVQVDVFLGDRRIHEYDKTNVLLRPSGPTPCNFQVNAIMKDRQDQELLVVKIKLYMSAEPEINRYTFEDLKWLSDDLLKLLCNPVLSDLRLRLPGNNHFSVHACILQARWNNFLISHQSNVDGEIEVQMSLGVLRDILVYLYSGKLHFGWPNNDANYITDLFRVIDLYPMNHLDHFLHRRNMHQQIVYEKNVNTVKLIFPLWQLVNGRFVGSMYRWHVNENTPYECTFTIYVQTYCSSPWLSYSLKSSSPICVYAQVNLDIRRIVETIENFDYTNYQITHVHQCDYTIQPKTCELSKNTLFLGCPETFGNFESSAQIIEGSHSMLCTLKFTDGRILERIQNTVNDTDAKEDEMNRSRLLGDHLFRLFSSQVESDLMINAPPTENENQPDETYYIHRAIFAARVHLWRKVFRDYQEPGDMPRETRLLLRSDALPFVLPYIYSSRYQGISPDLFDDIQNFADTGASHSLYNRIIHLRYAQDFDDWDSE